MLNIFVKSVKPELGFRTITDITYSLNSLIENLNENNFIKLSCRDEVLDYIINLLEREKTYE